VIQDLVLVNEERIQYLYGQIGKITRGLHSAIANLDVSKSEKFKESGALVRQAHDTHSHLRYVSDLTLEAAHKTMDLVEESAPIATELGNQSKELRKELLAMDPECVTQAESPDLHGRIARYLEFVELQSSDLNEKFTEIVVTQGYQDLSGQLLSRVMSSLASMEKNLLDLLETTNNMQHVSGIEKDPSAEKISAGSATADSVHIDRDDVLNSQDEVDDLLSNLGF
jgi:chemotaxis protein CheZ